MENIIIPSGRFLPVDEDEQHWKINLRFGTVKSATEYVSNESPFYNRYPVYTPMLLNAVQFDHIYTVDMTTAESVLAENTHIRLITRDEIAKYAESLLQIHQMIDAQHPQKLVFPVRGGVKPGLQLEVMRKFTIPSVWLPFTGGGGGGYHSEIRWAIDDIFKNMDLKNGLVLSIVDTAISGHSVRQLAKYIYERTQTESKLPFLRCYFNVLYSSSYPTKIGCIAALSSDKLSFKVYPQCVSSLLVEDWSPAIGWEVEYEGGKGIVKPSVREGELLLGTEKGQIFHLRSDRLDLVIDRELARSISDQINTEPSYQWMADVWQEYRSR